MRGGESRWTEVAPRCGLRCQLLDLDVCQSSRQPVAVVTVDERDGLLSLAMCGPGFRFETEVKAKSHLARALPGRTRGDTASRLGECPRNIRGFRFIARDEGALRAFRARAMRVSSPPTRYRAHSTSV